MQHQNPTLNINLRSQGRETQTFLPPHHTRLRRSISLPTSLHPAYFLPRQFTNLRNRKN
jgi:hypothetical protein